MAAADHIKSLITSYAEDDEHRFFATAMQIAASEARQGHTNIAQELKLVIEKARKGKSVGFLESKKTMPLNAPKRELSELIEVLKPRITLNDMVLAPEVEGALSRVVREQKNREVLKKHNLSPKRKLLLTGPPGTGKTMTAQALAGELDLSVYIIRLDGLISKYMGESIAKLRLIFDVMEDQRAVFLFDEFDSIGSHRDKGQEVGEIKRVLNSFLINIEKDRSNSIVIAATNLPSSLDTALFRRFDDIIDYPLPNTDEIELMLKRATHGYSFSRKINFRKIAELAKGLNYSDIVKASEDTIKEMVLSGADKLELGDLQYSLSKKYINGSTQSSTAH